MSTREQGPLLGQLNEHPPFPELELLPEGQAIELKQRSELASPTAGYGPMGLIQLAIEKGAPIETLRELFALKKEVEADEARKAYHEAMSAFKANPPEIIKDRTANMEKNGAVLYSYDYATLGNVCRQITNGLSKNGISHRWEIDQSVQSLIRVTCILTHKLGHSERTTLSAGSDQTGGKNAIQAIASAVTYLQRYTLLSAVGLAPEDDTDGVSQAPEWPELKDRLKLIAEAPDYVSLESAYKSSFRKAKEDKCVDDVFKRLIAAKDERKAKLAQENPA